MSTRRRWVVLLGALVVGCAAQEPTHESDLPDGGAVADTSDAGTSDAGHDRIPLASNCAQQFGRSVCEVTLDPASFGAGIEQVPSRGQDGRHYVCRPATSAAYAGRLLVHLVGTGSDPASDHRFVQLGCALGFAGIAPMYENADDARSVCGDEGPCYEGFHQEIVAGGDHAPRVSVDAPNSVLSRLRTILDALAADDPEFPAWADLRDAVASGDWSSVAVSGHSQGSGHALFLARDFHVERIVRLSGVNDRLASGTAANAPAPWVAGFPAAARTPASHALGFVHAGDSIAVVDQLLDNWDLLGLGARCDWASSGGYPADCRRIVMTTPACSGLLAHTSTVLARFGNGCLPGGTAHSNESTWTFLLTTPLP